ncbi:MAG: phytanoyl-CoA dioxygenase family protein [Cyanobacteria bacterium P01_D01_bin.50]
MILQQHFLYRLKLVFVFLLVKMEFIQRFVPKSLKDKLPTSTGLNNRMFWTAFKSRGKRVYLDYYSKLKEPVSYKPKAVVDSQYKLTEEDIRFFHENGYIGPFDLISSDEVKQIREHLVDLATNTESKIHSYSQGYYEFKESTSETEVNNNKEVSKVINLINRHLEDSLLQNLFKNSAITERCAQLLGPDLILWRSAFFQIPPHSNGTTWHQAHTWLFENMRESVVQPPDFEEIFQVTCWIALTDAYKENGCMALIPGSHKEMYPSKMNVNQKVLGKYERGNGNYGGELDYQVDPQKVKLIEMKAGQFYLFSERLVHGSADNVTDNSRWGVNGRITRTDVKVYTDKMLN